MRGGCRPKSGELSNRCCRQSVNSEFGVKSGLRQISVLAWLLLRRAAALQNQVPSAAIFAAPDCCSGGLSIAEH